ncbi:MAG: beta-ketoacyl synthase chain length factor [Methylotenera sp.]|nr:beta-ketoacyl synthase chain length factor [Oligoflexia bacterium]
MSLFVVGLGTANPEDCVQLRTQPEFRKASRNMMMSYLAIRQALENHDALDESTLGLVLGSSCGELEITRDFLCTLDQSKIARPLLFQNSLHNATTGFLALQLSVTGPSVSVSNRYFTSECSFEAAELLLKSGSARFCLVIAVESRVPMLEPGLKAIHSRKDATHELQFSENAAALLLTCDSTLPHLAEIESVRWSHKVQSTPRTPPHPFHDSDAISHLIGMFQGSAEKGTLLSIKSDGTQSEIIWHRSAR